MSPESNAAPAPDSRAEERSLTVEVDCDCDGRRLKVSFRCRPEQIRPALTHLIRTGIEPIRTPIHFDMMPDGRPICPRHRVPMGRREKQGDEWYSHAVLDDQGHKLSCRGYLGHGSEGYEWDRLTNWKD